MWALALTLCLSQAPGELPPEARVVPPAPQPLAASVVTRTLLATGGGALAGPVSLGITLLLFAQNKSLDPTFATAALSALMISGVAFTLHQALGGRGEIILSFLLSAAVMAGAAVIASNIDSSRDVAPWLTVAIGSLPAAAACALGLEGTSPQRAPIQVQVTATGVRGTF